ncbi:MAG TPA: MYG1 family protein [Candidatus Paceibacterota bacterium]|nr:MYG1 family protein [Candidatus Paceibacterota bacterium]
MKKQTEKNSPQKNSPPKSPMHKNSPHKILTHNGRFHADDCFSIAAFQIYFEKIGEPIEIIRSRDELLIKSADIVVDTGGIYDPETNRFDHHQEGGAGNRENGVPYSAFGLVWKNYGEKICDSKEVADLIDAEMIQSVDSVDNGYEAFESLKGVRNFTFDDFLKLLNPIRTEKADDDDESMDFFMDAVSVARKFLERIIKKTKLTIQDTHEVEKIYNETTDKRIIVLDKPLSWPNFLCKKPEPLYVVHPKYGSDYAVRAVPVVPNSLTMRKPFPENWRGKRGQEMAKASGVKTANFCHLRGFLCNVTDRAGAIELAKKAVEEQ